MHSEPIRVVRLIPVLDFGGVESRLVLQSTLSSSRIDLRVCTFAKPGSAANQIRQAGVAVDVLDVSARPNMRTALVLARYLRHVKPDVLHCSIAEANLFGLAAGFAARVPVRIAEEVGMPQHGGLAKLVYGGLYRTASGVVGVSKAVCRYLRDVDRAPADRVYLIYNCAHPRFFPERRRTVARDAEAKKRLLMVGRLHPVKNHTTVLEAFSEVLKAHPDARLDIAGDGGLNVELHALRAKLGLDDHVRFLGYRADVVDLLQGAGAFVLASHSEGCSISLIESMATGLPVLGSTVSGIREVMGDLSDEWTAPPTDVAAWTRLMCRYFAMDDSERQAIARRAQARAYDAFSPLRYVQELEQLYSSLLAA